MGCQTELPKTPTTTPTQKELTLNSREDSISYSLGINFAEKIKKQGLQSIKSNLFQEAFIKALNSDSTLLTLPKADSLLIVYNKELWTKQLERQLIEGHHFLEDNAKKQNVTTLESGLQYQIIREGDGTQPRSTQNVKCHYTGSLIDGTVFENTISTGTPTIFPVNGVIKGMEEALLLMRKGAKWKIFIPTELAYGEKPFPDGPILPNMALIYEIELLEILNN